MSPLYWVEIHMICTIRDREMEIIAIIMTNIYRGLTSTEFRTKHFTSVNAILVTMGWVGGISSPYFTEEAA